MRNADIHGVRNCCWCSQFQFSAPSLPNATTFTLLIRKQLAYKCRVPADCISQQNDALFCLFIWIQCMIINQTMLIYLTLLFREYSNKWNDAILFFYRSFLFVFFPEKKTCARSFLTDLSWYSQIWQSVNDRARNESVTVTNTSLFFMHTLTHIVTVVMKLSVPAYYLYLCFFFSVNKSAKIPRHKYTQWHNKMKRIKREYDNCEIFFHQSKWTCWNWNCLLFGWQRITMHRCSSPLEYINLKRSTISYLDNDFSQLFISNSR